MRPWLLAAVLLALLAAPAAQAKSSGEKTASKIFADYTKRGRLDACKYTSAELQTALDHVTPDIRQYASDYPDALKAAISQRAGGGCETASGGGGAAPPPAVTTNAPAVTPEPTVAPTTTTSAGRTVAEPPAPPVAEQPAPPSDSTAAIDRAAAASPDNDAPAPLVGLGVLALLLVLTAAMWLALRRYGVGEGRLAPAYHSWREARWRAGGVWEDFRDWLRLGR
ncbi:MAG: hypothetical protein QOF29_1962 [bacterium]